MRRTRRPIVSLAYLINDNKNVIKCNRGVSAITAAMSSYGRVRWTFKIQSPLQPLFPSLRLGYLVLPQVLVPVFTRAKWLADRQSPLLEQYVLADFINEGHLERHIRRMRTLYDRRRQALVQALTSHLGQQVTILGENAGIHLMVQLHTNLSDEEIIYRAAEVGVGLVSAQQYYLEAKRTGEFIFGYAELNEQQIQEGICRLANSIVEFCSYGA